MKSIELLMIRCMMHMVKYRSHIRILRCHHRFLLDMFNNKLDWHHDRTEKMLRCYRFCKDFNLTFHRLNKMYYR